MTTVHSKSKFDNLFKLLGETKNMSYFSSAYIQRLISYRFKKQFNFFKKVYLYVFLVNYTLIVISCCFIRQERDSDYGKARQVINGVNLVIVMFSDTVVELREISRKKRAYLNDFWNLNNLSFLISFYGACICDYYYGTVEITLIFHAALVIIGFFKCLSLGRIYKEFSFIVKMLVRVYEELTPFLILFASFIAIFGYAMRILGVKIDDKEGTYSGIGTFSYIIFVGRASLADFEMDRFKDLPPMSRMAGWSFWLMIVISNTVIFLNFLVAVISDVYEQIMETRVEEVY